MVVTVYPLPTLYKKSGRSIEQWDILSADAADGTAYTEVKHGEVGGKMQTTRVNYTKGKNIGRANATTPFQQAQSEALSKWNKKKDKGYVEDPSGESFFEAPFVMRAHKYGDYKHKVTFPAKVQPKFDGMRCLAVKQNGEVSLWSRGQKPIPTAPHIQDVLNGIMEDGEVLDGELYVHDMPLQQQASLFKKFDPVNHTKLTYRVYDMVSDGPYEDRYAVIKSKIEGNKDKLSGYVELSPTYPVHNHDEVIDWHNKFVEQGFEGAMLRHGQCHYQQNKKSMDMLKVKEFMDEEFEIIGAKENKGKMEGTCVLVCKTKDGGVFDAMPKGSQSERRQYWEDFKQGKLTGKMLTVRYFVMTPSTPPVPFHGVGVAIRDYE